MSSEALAQLDSVSKRYVLGQGRGAAGIVLDALTRREPRHNLWALRNVDLDVHRGQALGLVGRNGAGKTTALRLLAGISRPTQGHVKTYGRVASLLNVGAGFHPELTGRENVLLNGVILGLSRREASYRYEQIVDFAALDDAFMDTPVKHYSSGMYARLAFSVAVHVEPDVLLVDEVLSVGDAAFQDRSLRRMLEFRDRRQAAIVFVSHNLAAIELMCPDALWLERGVARATGSTADVLRAYLDAVDEASEDRDDRNLSIESVEVLASDGTRTSQLNSDERFTVIIRGATGRDLAEPVFVVTVRGDEGPLFAGNMHIDGNWPARIPRGPFEVRCAFESPKLRPGRYRLEIKVKQNVRTNYFEPRVMAFFDVRGPHGTSGGSGDVAYRMMGGGSW
jgi:ABC-type polysaccharide/polyol phosphate transport system ATPase subunit